MRQESEKEKLETQLRREELMRLQRTLEKRLCWMMKQGIRMLIPPYKFMAGNTAAAASAAFGAGNDGRESRSVNIQRSASMGSASLGGVGENSHANLGEESVVVGSRGGDSEADL